MADFKEQYYSLEEDEMQDIIQRAKNMESDAQQELLKIFLPFLSKWVNLIYHNKYKLADYDARQFIGLYVKDKSVGRYLRRNNLNAQGLKHIQECMRGVNYMVKRYGDEEDIRQTVNMTFFQCIERYERRESKAGGYVPFKGYLYRYFFYMLKKNVDTFLIDQHGRKSFPLISDDDFGDSGDSDGEKPQGFHAPAEQSAEELFGTEEIDEFWVIGDTALYPFSTLTIQERQLLKWRYVDGQKSSDIANRITEHPNTVREHFNRIRSKIAEELEEQRHRDKSMYKM